MVQYTIKRIGTGILSLLVLVSITFFLTRAIPGSPFESANVSGDILEMMEKEYSLDNPVIVQCGRYLLNVLRGELGYSYQNPSRAVTDVIAEFLPVTLTIGGLALLLAIVTGVTFGIWMTVSKQKMVRIILFSGTIFGIGVPNFALSLFVLLLFGVKLHWFPVVGLDGWEHYILPVCSLAAYPSSVICRMTAHVYREEMNKEYVVLARAKGLKDSQIVWRHILRHIWLPLLNYLGSAAAFLLTGSFAVESIFTIPGLGSQFVRAISNRDYTLIMGLTIFMGIVVILIQLLVDLLSAWIDPRIRRSYEG